MDVVSGNEGTTLPYQRTAAEQIARALSDYGRAAVVAPPRTGKLLMVAAALEVRPGRELLVLTPSVEAFRRRLRRLPEPLRSHMSEGRIVAYARVAAMDEGSLRRLWKSRIILDSFQRCGSERWGEAVRRLVDDPRDAEIIGISAYSLRPSDGGRDMVRELFGGRYAFHMELTDAWSSPEVPLEPPIFVEALLSWDDDLAGLRSRASGIASPSIRRMAREWLAELETALAHLGRSDGEVARHIPRTDGHYVVYCSRVADVAFVRDRLVRWLNSVNSRVASYQATYDVGSERAREAISAYAGDRSDALKLLFVIDKLRDWGEVPCDGAFCFRKTRSVNVLAGQVAQASRLAGSGDSVFVDLAGNLESAGVWEGRGLGLRERDGATRALLDYVSGNIVVTERTMRAAELLRRMDALLSGCGAKSGSAAPTAREWSREEDVALIDEYPVHGLKWNGWDEVLPKRVRGEIEKRAFVLGLKFGTPVRWSDKEDQLLACHYSLHGLDWDEWASLLPKKTPNLIRRRALSLSLPKEWTEEEIARLREYYPRHGAGWPGWKGVLPERTRKEVGAAAQDLGIRYKNLGETWSRKEDDVLLTNYESLGPLSPKWGRLLPDKPSREIRLRAQQLGLHAFKRTWTHSEDRKLRKQFKKGLPSEKSLFHSVESKNAMEIARRACELGLLTTVRIDAIKPISLAKRKNWVKSLDSTQAKWLRETVERLYPIFGSDWRGWEILHPKLDERIVRSLAGRLKLMNDYAMRCRFALSEGWTTDELRELREEFPVFSADSLHWQGRFGGRSAATIVRTALRLGIPQWSELREIAVNGQKLSVGDVFW